MQGDGLSQSGDNFTRALPQVTSLIGTATNYQNLNSPSTVQVIPGLDANLGGGYTVFAGDRSSMRFEAGYQAAVYINAINQYSLSETETPSDIPFEGNTSVFLRSTVGNQTNYFVHGPYVKLSLTF